MWRMPLSISRPRPRPPRRLLPWMAAISRRRSVKLLMSWPASEPAIHLAVCTMDGRVVKFTLRPRFARFGGPGHDKLGMERYALPKADTGHTGRNVMRWHHAVLAVLVFAAG